jgi:hypothetical protein
MTAIPINLAVEDLLSEVVLRTLLARSERDFAVGTVFNRGGFGYLRRTCPGWNNAAKGVPFLLLTDLDQYACPPALIDDWLPTRRHPNLIVRVAIREVESWILADSRNFSAFLGISRDAVPADPENLADAKQALVGLANRSRRTSTRTRLVPRIGSTAKQGPDYNQCLSEFVTRHWDEGEASASSPSLLGCIRALRVFRPTWQGRNEE